MTTPTAQTMLAPCPFCGAAAELKIGIKTTYVMCLKCEAVGPDIKDPQKCVVAWNASALRASQPAAQALSCDVQLVATIEQAIADFYLAWERKPDFARFIAAAIAQAPAGTGGNVREALHWYATDLDSTDRGQRAREALALTPPQAPDVMREKALRDEIWNLRQIVADVRLLRAAGRFKDFEGEPWLRRAENIDLHYDPCAALATTDAGSRG